MVKARDSYLLAQVITAKFQGTNLFRQRIFWIVVCYAFAMAQFNLGALYVNSGIHDYCAASRWWHKAARRGVEQAVLALRAIRLRTDYKSCE